MSNTWGFQYGPSDLPPVTELEGLTDVGISDPANGQPLVFNSTTNQWVNSNTVALPSIFVSNASGAQTIDFAQAESWRFSITGNVQFTVVNWPPSNQLARVTIEITNTGAFNVTSWPSGTIWSGGSVPTVTTGSGSKDLFVLISFDGGSTVFGTIAGQNYS